MDQREIVVLAKVCGQGWKICVDLNCRYVKGDFGTGSLNYKDIW